MEREPLSISASTRRARQDARLGITSPGGPPPPPPSGRIAAAAAAWGLRAARAMRNGPEPLAGLGELGDGQLAALVMLSFEAGARWGRENPGDPHEGQE